MLYFIRSNHCSNNRTGVEHIWWAIREDRLEFGASKMLQNLCCLERLKIAIIELKAPQSRHKSTQTCVNLYFRLYWNLSITLKKMYGWSFFVFFSKYEQVVRCILIREKEVCKNTYPFSIITWMKKTTAFKRAQLITMMMIISTGSIKVVKSVANIVLLRSTCRFVFCLWSLRLQ